LQFVAEHHPAVIAVSPPHLHPDRRVAARDDAPDWATAPGARRRLSVRAGRIVAWLRRHLLAEE
jgi:hypothetical protein